MYRRGESKVSKHKQEALKEGTLTCESESELEKKTDGITGRFFALPLILAYKEADTCGTGNTTRKD